MICFDIELCWERKLAKWGVIVLVPMYMDQRWVIRECLDGVVDFFGNVPIRCKSGSGVNGVILFAFVESFY